MSGPARTMGARWEEFRAKCIAPEASKTQVDSMRLAFFAGAFELLTLITLALDPGKDPTEADLALMDALDAEMRAELERLVKELA